MKGSDTSFSTLDLRAEGDLALREGQSQTAGLSTQMQRLAFLCLGVRNYGELMESRFIGFTVFIVPQVPVSRARPNLSFLTMTCFRFLSGSRLRGNSRHVVSVKYALGCLSW